LIAGVVLIGYAALVGGPLPGLLRRAEWPYRAPVAALAVWYGLAASFLVAVAHAARHLAAPGEHRHAGALGVLDACGVVPSPDGGGPEAVLPAAVFLVPAAAFGWELVRARRLRSRHLRVLNLVGRRSARLRATVLQHDRPAAYCLPGLGARVVVSEGALRRLTAGQLDAVLAHERAHIAGRHHLTLAAGRAFATVFRALPLARQLPEQTALLLEMAADDRALRRHSRLALATAMYALAAGPAPRGAFPAGGPGALVRLRRVLGARKPPHPALRGAVAALAVAMPLLPYLFGCAAGLA
jgi:Peptidase family M48